MAIKKSSSSGIPFGNNAGRPANPGPGQLYSNGQTARLELYTSAGAWENIVQETPGVSSITGNYVQSTNSGTIIIYGTNFVSGAIASAIGTNGVEVSASSTTYNSLVQISAVFTGLSNANEPYDIKVTNPSNLFGLLPDSLYINASPVWATSSGSLGSFAEQVSMSVSATATDETTITYALASGSSLPSGVTLNSASGLISGTPPDVASNTTYTFTINASDGANTVVPRTFSFISNAAPVWVTSAGSIGSFMQATSISVTISATDVSDSITYSLASGSSLPSGITLNSSTGVISGTLPVISVDTVYNFTINVNDGFNVIPRAFSITSTTTFTIEYLVVAGGGSGTSNNGGGTGGGGAGGFQFGTQTIPLGSQTQRLITVGNGGATASGRNFGYQGENSVFGSITSIGGGWGNCSTNTGGGEGGSGGGGGEFDGAQGERGFGTSGQGYDGGTGTGTGTNSGGGGGGAGGAGGNGDSANGSTPARQGGPGLPSSITGAATYYAGGGGASGNSRHGGNGGIGGGGNGGAGAGGLNSSQGYSAGVPNTGGGGGGAHTTNTPYGGGSGVVVVAYPNGLPALTVPGTLTYDQPTRSGYRVYRFTAGSGTITL